MSARLAPLPPSRSFIVALPSALALPKKYTRLTALPPPLRAGLEPDLPAFDLPLRTALIRDLPREATATPLFLAMFDCLLTPAGAPRARRVRRGFGARGSRASRCCLLGRG